LFWNEKLFLFLYMEHECVIFGQWGYFKRVLEIEFDCHFWVVVWLHFPCKVEITQTIVLFSWKPIVCRNYVKVKNGWVDMWKSQIVCFHLCVKFDFQYTLWTDTLYFGTAYIFIFWLLLYNLNWFMYLF